MDSKSIKRIIAREGLIILAILLAGFLLQLLGRRLLDFSCPTPAEIYDFVPCKYQFLFWVSRFLGKTGTFILAFGYLLYLLIRFIIWAVRTLREGK